MPNHGDFRSQFTSAMEKLLHNVVSETMQLFENSVQELKVEMVRVRKENDNLNHKLNCFEKSRTCLDTEKSSIPMTKENDHKRDIAVQCDRLTLVERSSSPWTQHEDDERSTFQNLCQGLSEEENRQLALVLVKQEELDLDDQSTGYFLLKQEDGEPKLIRKQHIKDIPPEVFLSTRVRKKTTKEGLFGKVSSESPLLCTGVETEAQWISTCEFKTRNQGSKETNQENISLSACTSSTKAQAPASFQSETTSLLSTTVRFPQSNKLHIGTSERSQASASPSLSTCTQVKGSAQLSNVRIQSAPPPLAKSQTLSSPQSLKSAPSSPAGQVLFPAGMSPLQLVSSPTQKCQMPVLPDRDPSLSVAMGTGAHPSHVVLGPVPPTPFQANPYHLQSIQVPGSVHMPNQTPVQPRQTQVPVSISTQKLQNTEKKSETPLPFTHMTTQSVPSRAAFCSSTPKPYSMVSPTSIRTQFPPGQNLAPLALPIQIPRQSPVLSSPSLQSPSLAPVTPHGSLSQTSSPTHHPSPCLPSALHSRSDTSPAILQQNCSALSIMHFGAPPISSTPCPVTANRHALPMEHNSSVCQMVSNMPLVGLLQNPAPAVGSSVPDHQLENPAGHSFQSTHETSQVPLTYPLESLYASLDPMHDSEEPTLTTLHPPSLFDPTNILTENLSSMNSHQCVALAQPGTSLQMPCIKPDQFTSHHSESLTLPGTPDSTLTIVDLNRQFRNSPTCSGLSSASTQQCGESFSNINKVSQERQVYSNSGFLKLRNFRAHPESNRTRTTEGSSLDDEKESTFKSSLSSDRPTNQTGDTATLFGMASEKNNLSKDGKEVCVGGLVKPGKNQASKNQCEVCGRVLSNASALENHSRLHTGERPFSCDKCGKAFPSVRGLNRHVQIHAEEKQHQCPECGKSFVYHFTLTKHQLIHTGEKPYPCKVCGKRFLAKADRVTHMRMHTGEKPYSCTMCGKRFKHRMALNMHMQGHRGEKRYSCPTCGKGFVDLGNFKRHKRIHTGEKPYECKVCGKRFTQSAHLKKHMNTQHVTDQ